MSDLSQMISLFRAKHASIVSVMLLEGFNSMNSSDNEDNCSVDKNFNTSFTSLTTESGTTEDFPDAESTLQASDNIQPRANNTMSGSDGTLLPVSATGLTREAADTTDGDQQALTTEATDGTMPAATTATEPTTKATDVTMPVATAATEPTTAATDGTMPLTTAAMETTGETT